MTENRLTGEGKNTNTAIGAKENTVLMTHIAMNLNRNTHHGHEDGQGLEAAAVQVIVMTAAIADIANIATNMANVQEGTKAIRLIAKEVMEKLLLKERMKRLSRRMYKRRKSKLKKHKEMTALSWLVEYIYKSMRRKSMFSSLRQVLAKSVMYV